MCLATSRHIHINSCWPFQDHNTSDNHSTTNSSIIKLTLPHTIGAPKNVLKFFWQKEYAWKYSITLDPNVLPLQHGRCRVPIKAKEDIRIWLWEMTALGISTPQAEPAPWVNSHAYSCKANGTLRVCQDPQYQNKAICECHKSPTLEITG